MDKKRIAVICNFSIEPRALGTYDVMYRAYSVCAPWFKRNLIESFEREGYEVDLYMFANYGDEKEHNEEKAQETKAHIEELFNPTRFHLDSFHDIVTEMSGRVGHEFNLEKRGVMQINLWQTYTLLTSLERIDQSYDYYVKARIDSFHSPRLNLEQALGNVKKRSLGQMVTYQNGKTENYRFNQDIGIHEDHNFIISPSVRNVPSNNRPWLIGDTLMLFDSVAMKKMLRAKDRWIRKIARDFDGQLWYLKEDIDYCWPETALGSLPAMANVAMHGDRDFDCTLYRYVMYDADDKIREYFLDVSSYESYQKIAEWTMKDYVMWTDPATGNARASKFIETLGGSKSTGLKYVDK